MNCHHLQQEDWRVVALLLCALASCVCGDCVVQPVGGKETCMSTEPEICDSNTYPDEIQICVVVQGDLKISDCQG